MIGIPTLSAITVLSKSPQTAFTMGGIRRRDSPISMSSAKKPHVGFVDTLVTGVSRPLTNNEEWTLWYFESHAAKCGDCRHPYKVQAEGRKLCDKGFDRAYDVAKLLFRIRKDGSCYYMNKQEDQEVRVELPRDYAHVVGLLKAIERSKHTFLSRPKSYDRTYPVAPRLPRSGSVREPRAPAFPLYNTRTDEPLAPKSHRKSWVPSQEPSWVRRGSLYANDQLAIEDQERRERMAPYNLELHFPHPHMFARRQRTG